MKSIKCTFKSNGEDVTVTAIVNDELSELSKSKRNQATDIIGELIRDFHHMLTDGDESQMTFLKKIN